MIKNYTIKKFVFKHDSPYNVFLLFERKFKALTELAIINANKRLTD